METGKYRNMFAELGIDEARVTERVDAIFQQLFVVGDAADERLFFEAPDASGGYIHSVDSNDVRSEGMSYGSAPSPAAGSKCVARPRC